MTLQNQEKFKILLKQLNMVDHLDSDVVEQGELTRIDVSKKLRAWTFHIALPHFLKYEDYAVFTHAMQETFKHIAKVDWTFEIKDTSQQDEYILKYFNECIDQTHLSPKVKGQLKQKRMMMSGSVVKILVQNDVERDHFDKSCNGSLVKALQRCGFDI
ncbi:PolC-type DNA polymerase III N-terminal domain-containing protein, partial [Staphylococcus felis]